MALKMSKPPKAAGYRPAVNELVLVGPKKVRAVAKYVGETRFAQGEWIGVELAEPFGKNDGSVQGVRYFECRRGHGLFLRQHLLEEAPSIPEAPPLDIDASKAEAVSPADSADGQTVSRKHSFDSADPVMVSRKQSFQEAMQRMEDELLDKEDDSPIVTRTDSMSRDQLCSRLWALADEDKSGSLDKAEFTRVLLTVDEDADAEAAAKTYDDLHGIVKEEGLYDKYFTPTYDRMNFGFFSELFAKEEGLAVSDASLRDAVECLEAEVSEKGRTGFRVRVTVPEASTSQRDQRESPRGGLTSGLRGGGHGDSTGFTNASGASRCSSCATVCGGLLRPARASLGWRPRSPRELNSP